MLFIAFSLSFSVLTPGKMVIIVLLSALKDTAISIVFILWQALGGHIELTLGGICIKISHVSSHVFDILGISLSIALSSLLYTPVFLFIKW
jgi:hypothetical protein